VNGGESGWRSDCRNSPINQARLFPLGQRKRRKLTLRSELGSISLRVDYGLDRQTGEWLSPAQRVWGLGPHQKLTPGFAEKLCFTVTATGCYEEAAQVVSKWSGPMDDSTLHSLVQRMGEQAEEQRQARLTQTPKERQPQRAASALAVLMVDGWQVRHRGEGWGRKKTAKPRVEWHEMKTGVFYLQEQAAQTQGGRGLIEDKVVVSVVGEPMELGQRLHWEAQRGGLGRARQQLFLGDGAPWIWIEAGSVGPGEGTAGFFSCQPAPLGSGADGRGRGRRQAGALGGSAAASTQARTGKESVVRVGWVEKETRSSG
jgi:hypothetical protein